MRTAIAVALALACSVLLTGGTAARDVQTSFDLGGSGGPDRHPGHDLLWSQGPGLTSYGVASQIAGDYPFWAECATDFFALESAEVNHIHWWGIWYPAARDGRPTFSVERTTWNGEGDRALTCEDAQWAGCNVAIAGDNTGGPNHASFYNCIGWDETGPEVVYLLTIPRTPTTLVVSIGGLSADLDLFLLSTCSENACITYANTDFTIELPAGEYYLVVDGYFGATSTYWLNIHCLEVPPLYFVARFYEDVNDEPGDLLYEHYFSDYSEVWVDDPGVFAYWADIPPFPITHGQFYWMSIQSILDFGCFGQWYWQVADNALLEWPVMYFDAIGIPRWTSLPDAIGQASDLAFELAEIETPVKATSWGAIKSLYR